MLRVDFRSHDREGSQDVIQTMGWSDRGPKIADQNTVLDQPDSMAIPDKSRTRGLHPALRPVHHTAHRWPRVIAAMQRMIEPRTLRPARVQDLFWIRRRVWRLKAENVV